MKNHMPEHEHSPDRRDPALSRRALIHGGIIAGAGLLLTGCTSGSRPQRTASRLPEPRWPSTPEYTRRPREWDEPAPRPEPMQPETQPLPREAGTIIPRNSWASAPPIPRRMDRMRPVWRITVHHDGMPPVSLQSQSDVASRIDRIRSAHQGQGWGDIGYHFVVDPFGRVWQGRPLEFQGAHVRAENEGNLGVLVLGNFEQQTPTGQALSTLDRFVIAQMRRFNVGVSRVLTHRELGPTACPGRTLQAHMQRIRHSNGALSMA
ncbi:MAG: hypothetical protein EA376_09215 [Phycisphaeraceae bacterium]|nr:MAG: hypothetical protein EA376_09215 [Phycisphaeraceae bacterium]